MKKQKLSILEKKLIAQAIKDNGGIKLGICKSQQLGWSDLPMFNQIEKQKKIF